MNYYTIFYWMTVADSVKVFFDKASTFFTVASSITLIVLIITSIIKVINIASENSKDEATDKTTPNVRSVELIRKMASRLFYVFMGIAIFMWAGWVFTPTKKDCLLIVAGGAVGNFITTDTAAKQLPSDITKFLHMSLKEEIDEIGEEARRDFGVQTPKEKLIDKAARMTKEELLNYLKTDTTLVK